MRNPFKRKTSVLKRIFGGVKNAAAFGFGSLVHGLFSVSGRYRRRRLVRQLRRGDVILASPKTLQLSPNALIYRLLLRAKFVHSMLYLGDNKIIHVTARYGVKVDNLPRKIHKPDRYRIYGSVEITEAQRDAILNHALKLQGKKLDHAGLWTNVPTRIFGLKKPLLSFEKNRLWCSKLIQLCYKAADIELVDEKKSANITSEDLSESPVLRRLH